MKVGVYTKDTPMELECIDEASGVYNMYCPGQLDMKYLCDLASNPPEGVKYVTVFDKDNKDKWRTFLKDFCKKHNLKYYRFDQDGFVHYVIDVEDGMPEEYRNCVDEEKVEYGKFI